MKNKQHTTTAGEDYLESVLILQKKLGMVRSVDVARYMEVSKPSVCYAVGTLREGGFLTTDENHYHTPDRPWPGCGRKNLRTPLFFYSSTYIRWS